MIGQHLRLVLEPPERAGVGHPIAIALELGAIRMRRLRLHASAGARGALRPGSETRILAFLDQLARAHALLPQLLLEQPLQQPAILIGELVGL